MKILLNEKLGIFLREFYTDERLGVFSFYLPFSLENINVLNYNDILDKLECDEVIDEGLPKIKAEFLACAYAYAYDNDTLAQQVKIKVGEIEKSLVVFGERKNLTSPVPFKKVAIKYYDVYPPLVEYKSKLVTSEKDRYIPASFSPLPVLKRFKKFKISSDYVKNWPKFPRGIDFGVFNMASADQQKEGFFTNDEILLENLHPLKPVVKSRIPDENVRCFIQKDDSFLELTLRKDTLILFPHKDIGIVVFRGVTDVERNFRDIEYLFVEIEKQKRESSYYYEEFLKKTSKEKTENFTEEKKQNSNMQIKKEIAKISKSIKDAARKFSKKSPRIKFSDSEMSRLLNSADITSVSLAAASIKNEIKNHIYNLKQMDPSVSQLLKEETSKQETWEEDGFDFVNYCAKYMLFNLKKYNEELIKRSLIGFNPQDTESLWGGEKVSLPKGVVFPRFEKTTLKSVRIQNENGVFLIKGSDEKFPLFLKEGKNYPLFVTSKDIDGWLVNDEAFDMCNVLVCDNLDDLDSKYSSLFEGEVFYFDFGYAHDDWIKIDLEKYSSIKEAYNDGELRRILLKYMDVKEYSYVEELEELDRDIENTVNKKSEETEKKLLQKKESFKKDIENIEFEDIKNLPEFKSFLEHYDAEVPLKENASDYKKLYDSLINYLSSFEEIEKEKLKILKRNVEKFLQFKNDIKLKTEKLKNDIDALKEKLGAQKSVFEQKQSKKVKFNNEDFIQNNYFRQSLINIDLEQNDINGKNVSLSTISGSCNKCVFTKCVFENCKIDVVFLECVFKECVFKNCVFSKDIKGEFKNCIVENNLFENINLKIIGKFDKNIFTKCGISGTFIKSFANTFVGSDMDNVVFDGEKNTFSNSSVKNFEIKNSKYLTFAASALENGKFVSNTPKLRFMKKCQLNKVNFKECEKSTFYECEIKECVFIKSDFKTSIFNKSRFEYCDFRKMDAKFSRFEDSVFQRCDFRGSNLFKSSLGGSIFEFCDFSYACLYSLSLLDLKFKNSLFENANLKKTLIKREYFENNESND